MALGGCDTVIKVIIFIFNIVFWVVGAALLSVGIWLRVSFSEYLDANEELQKYVIGTYVMIAVGVYLMVIASFGNYGACRESPCMLGTYMILLTILVIAEVAGGVFFYKNKDEINRKYQESLLDTIKYQYNRDPIKQRAIDLMQSELKCCGSLGPGDWAYSEYNGRDKSSLEVGVLGILGAYRVPMSCCATPDMPEVCSRVTGNIGGIGSLFKGVYSEGCSKKTWDYFVKNSDAVFATSLTILGLQVFALVLSLIMCCAMNRGGRYKA